jgi:RNA polymerase sigma-70 factor (ECF subfamily)
MSDEAVQAEVDSLRAPDREEAGDTAAALRQMVDELPDTARRIVTLYYFEEQSVTAVADLVGLPEGTIKTHLFRARSRLLARLQSLGIAGDPDGR